MKVASKSHGLHSHTVGSYAILNIVKTLIVIFGITGDLSTRKLLPALTQIVQRGLNDAGELEILGISRREFDVVKLTADATGSDTLGAISASFTMDMAQLADYARLKAKIAQYRADQALIYLSVPPGAAAHIVDLLGEAGINDAKTRLLFEKPFGFDLESAQDYIQRTSRYFEESQLYRIDHYMAKEISADLLQLRRDADTAHHNWGAHTVKSVTIAATEKIGIEGRTQFYEQTGALRDFIQGHLMQLASLVLMTKPVLSEGLPVQRLKALNHLKPANPAHAIRAQYDTYQQEVENPGSPTETFVSIELYSDDPHWQGVPIRLVTGKALSTKRSFVEVEYHDGTKDTFEEGVGHIAAADQQLDAYQRVLLQAIEGNKELFTTSEEVVRSWEVLAPVQAAWNMDDTPLVRYASGSDFLEVIQT